LSFLLLGARGALAGDATRVVLSATVAGQASITAVSAPTQVQLAEADLTRGYLDLPQALEVALRTNLPRGVLLAGRSGNGALRGVALSAAGEPGVHASEAGLLVDKVGVGLREQRVRLYVRLLLGPGAAAGPMAWPVAFSLMPR
jgi:hypothetical protein